ncbi:MAG: NAD(P)H-binding protein [Clostridium sp.]|uniref:NAD(P)H-binding protein n=1 Tax=Clostridium sp. TaxID=1506 RepID=UPI001ECBA916|nr:NAD(P)H-binding protein [Clostridium sp.]MBS5886491.1 NAD(P)H-binding protein [Clostridium sp.]MDU7147689.1 NAD(P)H-binding protein [Clostridium sp.]MDU7241580.1 NAD(P)H-binding protein [Clostridium sp.]
MTKIVLVGGNGYIGREITKQWLKRDSDIQIYVTSRSGRQEIKDERVHHIQVDVENYEEFEKSIPSDIDYIVSLIYGNMEGLKTIRKFSEKHGIKAIGNINAVANAPGFEEFVAMKNNELDFLKESSVRVANYDLTIAYGSDRDDDLANAIRAGYMDAVHPVRVEIVACSLIDELLKSWLA